MTCNFVLNDNCKANTVKPTLVVTISLGFSVDIR